MAVNWKQIRDEQPTTTAPALDWIRVSPDMKRRVEVWVRRAEIVSRCANQTSQDALVIDEAQAIIEALLYGEEIDT